MGNLSADQLVASAAQFLLEGQESDAALLLLFCSAELAYDPYDYGGFRVTLTGPRLVWEKLKDDDDPITRAVEQAFHAVTPIDDDFRGFSIRAPLVDIQDSAWRQELLEIAEGRGVHNQGTPIPNRSVVVWKTLRFRSESERRIAIALDVSGVLYLPNCLVRLGSAGAQSSCDQRATRESDFLICHEGKWGILEVDGPFHPRAVEDHERDRLFQTHGIRVVQRFDWQQCFNHAPAVVKQFLDLLARNG